MPRPTCASALWPARSSKPWPAIPTGTLPMRRRGGIISRGSASPTWRSIPTRSASPPKARCGGRSRGCCPTPCPTTVRARGLVLGPCRAPSSTPSPTSNTPPSSACALVWWFYADLKAYRRDPRRRAALRAPFHRIFPPRPPFATLDRLLDRLSAHTDEVLRVLDPPEVPPHRVRPARAASRPAVRQQGRVAAGAGPARGAAAHQRLRARPPAAGDQAQDLGRNPLRSGP